jgi:TPR repeat protein|mmetsp:Transcript_13756/g.2202  ORF Transcript_13756/g.2202 Transcript_13756/m.2202 type:complete len:98 (+) Transcript_13756:68-361(+)
MYTKSINAIGYMKQEGIYSEKDEDYAFILYSLSAELDNDEGLYYLAMAYKNGIGVEKDNYYYVLHLLSIDILNNVLAHYEFGTLYEEFNELSISCHE